MEPTLSATSVQAAPTNHSCDINKLKRAFAYKLFYQQGKTVLSVSLNDYYQAVALTVRDRMQHLFINSTEAQLEKESRLVCYLSAEFLPGPHLCNSLINLGFFNEFAIAARETGLDLKAIIDQEKEPGLGNGGLGRLAACYLDSLATQQIPAIGYGIRYEFGMFDQEIVNGWQKEFSDRWLQLGNPWEVKKADLVQEVGFGGCTESYVNGQGNRHHRWVPARVVIGIPYDTPIPGYKVNTVNTLRLWSAEAPKSFDFQDFNVGDYFGAVAEKISAENITKVLYPNDEQFQGKKLRLEQQYFFVCCSLKDMIRMHLFCHDSLDNFHDNFAVQINDTHPAVAIPEFMRLLLDEHCLNWEEAWDITTRTFSYTNHTLLPESQDKWPLSLFGSLLPRHLEIIFEINHRFLDQVRLRYPGDETIVRNLSIIDESGPRSLRMAHLACVGSQTINGVAAVHTHLLKTSSLADFHRLWPQKIINITNGVTPRRWMLVSNPRLSQLINEAIGEAWITDLTQLRRLEPLADDAAFRTAWRRVKQENKEDIAAFARDRHRVTLDINALFDVQVKRIHEYKRQHLNLLHIITLYNRLKANPTLDLTPRVCIFGGKAAPGYFMAKLIIKCINAVAEVVNNDPDTRDRLHVYFLPNHNVQTGHLVYPVSDLSEQISLAGKEASGTGNMKFALSGAVTIGTADGANIEIREEVGEDNFFLFGLSVPEVEQLQATGYRPADYYLSDDELRAAIDLIRSGHFSHGDHDLFQPLLTNLLEHDPYLVLADYRSYVDCQQQAADSYRKREQWTRMSILNVARMGKFSSDRSIAQYCREVWRVKPFPIELKWQRIPEGGIVFPRLS
ncbi:glycogen/starch/alpha-glucan phosphorylase [Desulfobulbus alkaliphilus]|uniref:glycogen/starch/alpha-glucan phosphorylase n=1 Tax=Desulfobulbus alkaliphilus TaxID=869814 RepID=UPI0019639292|nr:glycogen/starch/alpha-glucan phosphorylase [Desulfobulbus alkaliphilus]MBM9538279.1 glycogen/starch/alpha-glucan phosphorylase [Desulfobulbus alkaliphilus]